MTEKLRNLLFKGFTGATICAGLIFLISNLIPPFYTGTKVNENKISITKREGLTSIVSYEYFIHSKIESISFHDFNPFKESKLKSLTDYDWDELVDEIDYGDSAKKRTYSIDSLAFKEADSIYQEQIRRFKE